MSAIVVVGAQWGDEGKGRVVDWLARDAHIVARFNGGDNAGHTVVAQGHTLKLHLVPSGVLRPDLTCLIGAGVVINPERLVTEMDELTALGVDVGSARLKLSAAAHIILPTHRALDGARDAARGQSAIGTTKRGIGPTYADKAARTGIRLCELIDPSVCRTMLQQNIPFVNKVLQDVYGADPVDPAETIDWAVHRGETLRPMTGDTVEFLHERTRSGKRILFEGAQGSLLDVDFGTYPFNTSSNSSVGGMVTGSGLPPREIGRVIGVLKTYTTRVGAGPFPTELDDETGLLLRERGGEFGATTGRPRRCGWFDVVAARFSAKINGVDELALTKLDVLAGMDPIKICVAYEINGRRTEAFPARAAALAAARPVYEEMPGWRGETAPGGRLCPEAAAYVDKLCEVTGAPARIISVGRKRSETIIA